MATGTQEAPASASKVEASAIRAGETNVFKNIGNTDNTDTVSAELVSNQDATSARIAGVAARVAVASVTVAPTTSTKAAEGTQQLTPTVLPAGAFGKGVTYSSDKPDIAEVSSTGLVTAKKSGTAVITVTTIDGSKKATHTITVS